VMMRFDSTILCIMSFTLGYISCYMALAGFGDDSTFNIYRRHVFCVFFGDSGLMTNTTFLISFLNCKLEIVMEKRLISNECKESHGQQILAEICFFFLTHSSQRDGQMNAFP
jgi:hypothetical protein